MDIPDEWTRKGRVTTGVIVENLVEKGVVKKVPGEARSLVVLDYEHKETVALFEEKMRTATEEEKAILEKAKEILGI